MSNAEEFSTVYDLVFKLLQKDEKCRNYDKWLNYRVLCYYLEQPPTYEEFLRIPSFETIRRNRQKIQNQEKLFRPTKQDVLERRSQREAFVREWSKGDNYD